MQQNSSPNAANSRWRTFSRYLCGAVFTVLGILHFTKTGMYMKVMPPGIPFPLECVYLSGVAEMAGGLGLLYPKTRRAAAFGLIALLIAVYPANIYMATQPEQFPNIPDWLLYLRLPLQVPIAWWVWRCR